MTYDKEWEEDEYDPLIADNEISHEEIRRQLDDEERLENWDDSHDSYSEQSDE